MSYLILIVAFVYGMWALACSAVQVLSSLCKAINKQNLEFSFKSTIRYSVISFVLTCLAIYLNHWPKR